jgi:hypothetical protein
MDDKNPSASAQESARQALQEQSFGPTDRPRGIPSASSALAINTNTSSTSSQHLCHRDFVYNALDQASKIADSTLKDYDDNIASLDQEVEQRKD